MGKLKPKMANARYCNAGQLSPLFNDPFYQTIGIGTRVFLGGAQGYVTRSGTQHNPNVPRRENGTPTRPAGTLALIGDLNQMDCKWLKAVSIIGYGVTLSIALGVPIPILDEEILRYTTISDDEIIAPVIDFSRFYPTGVGEPILGEVTYAELRRGAIRLKGKTIPTASFSSYANARKVAEHLKELIYNEIFMLTEAQAHLPGAFIKENVRL
jgi:uncharacterized protein (DUF39 family)